MPHYSLQPFNVYDAIAVASWLLDADDVALATGERRYPVEPADVIVWSHEASRAYLLTCDGEPAGYAELVEDEADGDLDIDHVVLAPERRHDETGCQLLELLTSEARRGFPYDAVWLRVHRENIRQIDHAAKVGFVESPEVSGPKFIWHKKHYGNHS